MIKVPEKLLVVASKVSESRALHILTYAYGLITLVMNLLSVDKYSALKGQRNSLICNPPCSVSILLKTA